MRRNSAKMQHISISVDARCSGWSSRLQRSWRMLMLRFMFVTLRAVAAAAADEEDDDDRE